jgi:hypothetical protein
VNQRVTLAAAPELKNCKEYEKLNVAAAETIISDPKVPVYEVRAKLLYATFLPLVEKIDVPDLPVQVTALGEV